MTTSNNTKRTVHIPVDMQLESIAKKKDIAAERKRLEQELSAPYIKEVTAEKVNDALNALAETPQEQIKCLHLGDVLVEYVEANRNLTERLNHLLDDTAKTMTVLTKEANKRNAELLTPERLKELLYSDLQIKVINQNDDTFRKLESEFDLFSATLSKKLTETVASIENRFNLLIVLQFITMILLFVF